MRALAGFLLCAAVCLSQNTQGGPEVTNPLQDQTAAVEAGQRRFRETCAACHGATGEGGRGPKLADNQDLQHLTDEQLFNTIRHGIPGTDMPPSPMPDSTTWEVVTFIRSLSAPAFRAPVKGDAEAGRVLFFGSAGCSRCHMIRGVGGFLGPDLTNIAASSTARRLRDSILHPELHRVDGFMGVTAVLKDGTGIEGIAKNNSNYSIQILDSQGTLHLLDKSNLQEIDFHAKSLMPDNYGQTLKPEDLENLLAYLCKQAVRTEFRRPGRQLRLNEN
jgi:cytochrome c oxidase cbb3-type subunit III